MQFAALPRKINLIKDTHIKWMSQSLRRHLSRNILEQTQQEGGNSFRGWSQSAFVMWNCVPCILQKWGLKPDQRDYLWNMLRWICVGNFEWKLDAWQVLVLFCGVTWCLRKAEFDEFGRKVREIIHPKLSVLQETQSSLNHKSAPAEKLWFSAKLNQALCSTWFFSNILISSRCRTCGWGEPGGGRGTCCWFSGDIHSTTHTKHFQQVYPEGAAGVSRHL